MTKKIKSPRKDNLIDKSKIVNGIGYPVFCFKHLRLIKWDNVQLKDFIERLQKLQQLGWNEINKSHRHSFGYEKIPIEAIIPELPDFVTPDVNFLFAFRYTGDNRPFLAMRNGDILHVIFIEANFGDIYDHGK